MVQNKQMSPHRVNGTLPTHCESTVIRRRFSSSDAEQADEPAQAERDLTDPLHDHSGPQAFLFQLMQNKMRSPHRVNGAVPTHCNKNKSFRGFHNFRKLGTVSLYDTERFPHIRSL